MYSNHLPPPKTFDLSSLPNDITIPPPLIDIEPLLIEVYCKSFSNDTSEDDILSLLKPYFGKEHYTTFDKYITNCMIIPGQNKAIVQINDKSFGNFIFENYQVLNNDFPLIFKGNEVRFNKLAMENGEIDYDNDKIMDSDVSNSHSTKLTSSSDWNIDNNSIDEYDDHKNSNINGINIDKLLDDIILPTSEHNIALYGWTPNNKMYGNEISLNLPQNVVNKILCESKINNIPAQSFCLMVGFLTHNGPISLNYYRSQKQNKLIHEQQQQQKEINRKRQEIIQHKRKINEINKITSKNINNNNNNNYINDKLKERDFGILLEKEREKSITPPILQCCNDNDVNCRVLSPQSNQSCSSSGGGMMVTSPTNTNSSSYSSNSIQQQQQPQTRLIKKRNNNNNKLKLSTKLIENGFKTPVVMINNLNENRITCDKLFMLCGVFGDVIRVKISYNKRDTAFVQLINHEQAKNVINSLNRIQLYGKMIYVNLSRIKKIKLPKDSPNSAMKFPDRKYLTKNYVNSKKHRYSKKNNNFNTLPLPNNILYIYNLPNIDNNIIKNKLINFLQGNNNNKIKNINIINNEKAFIECYSLDYACQILIDNHLKLFYGNELKILFAKKYNNDNNIGDILTNGCQYDDIQSPKDKLIEKKFHMKKRTLNKRKSLNMNTNNNQYNGKMYYQQIYRKKE